MASPQLENGYVPVAHDLYLAIDLAHFTALEREVLSAVMYMTYGVQKTKALISAEDIRYYLGSPKTLRTARVQDTIDALVGKKVLIRQPLKDGNSLLGVQKNYDEWALKINATLQEVYITTNKLPVKDALKNNAPEIRLLDYAQIKSQFKLSVAAWRAERKQARLLYQNVLAKTHSGPEAFDLICDYIDENDWMRQNVRMQFTFMASRFEAWRTQIPRKPRDVKDDEEALGKRHRYDVNKKQWLPCEARKEGESND